MTYVYLFLAAYFAATVSASIGFGGALIFLPILAHLVGIKEAVPVLTIAQLFGNGSRFWFGRGEIRWPPVLYFLSGAIPFAIVACTLYSGMQALWLFKVVSAFLIAVVILRRMKVRKIEAGNLGMVAGGALTGFLSGLAGSAGPTGSLFFLGLNLPPVAFVASDAFASLVLHMTKIVVYSRFSLIHLRGLLIGTLLGVAMVAGSYTGKIVLSRVSKETFMVIVEILIVGFGIQMIFFTGSL